MFFLEQTINRQIDLLCWLFRSPACWTGLESLSESRQNRLSYRFYSTICKNLLWWYKRCLRHFLIFQRKLIEWYLKCPPIKSIKRTLFTCTYYRSISSDVSKKSFIWCSVTFEHIEKIQLLKVVTYYTTVESTLHFVCFE